jgi:hypothetical protein
MFCRFALPLSVLALFSPLAFGDVRVIGISGDLTFDDLPAAVDAAKEGDAILVADGSYTGFVIDGKSLSIIAVPGANPEVVGTITVRNLRGSRAVVITGLDVTGAEQAVQSEPAVFLNTNVGAVHFEDCNLTGGAGSEPFGHDDTFGAGASAVVLHDSLQVAFIKCTIRGGEGGGECCQGFTCVGGDAGHGIDAENSAVAIFDSDLIGGEGGDCGTSGGNGGHAYRGTDLGLVAIGSTFSGGRGGDAWDFLPIDGAGDGGHGLVTLSAAVRLRDNDFVGGLTGWSCCGAAPGVPGSSMFPTLSQEPLLSRVFETPSTLRSDDLLLPITVTGEPGEMAFVSYSTTAQHNYLAPYTGTLLIPMDGRFPGVPLGQIPISGVLNSAIRVPAVIFQEHRQLFLQGATMQPGRPSLLGTPMHVLLLNRKGGSDCNANTNHDVFDVLEGFSTDCDRNLVPDECDSDCNGNSIPDACDIETGFSIDCNTNGIPDSCETLSDCNSNSIPDECDVASGFSADLNSSGIPDECEASGLTWYVDAAAGRGGDGSLLAPFQTIATGVAATLSGDTVIVKDGLYSGPGNRAISFNSKGVHVRSENGPLGCVIDCGGVTRAFELTQGESLAARIEGFTILNGLADDPNGGGFQRGGGIYVETASVTVIDCVIRDCTSARDGGGIYVLLGDAVIDGCTFADNTSVAFDSIGFGGGVFLSTGDFVVKNSVFEGNHAGKGGALYVIGQSTNARISHCSVFANTSNGSGAGIANWISNPLGQTNGMEVDNCLIAGNVGPHGSGIFSTGSQNFIDITNCTIADNVADAAGSGGGGIAASVGCTIAVTNCVLWGNTGVFGAQFWVNGAGASATISHCTFEGSSAGLHNTTGVGLWGPGNNTAQSPLFVDPDGADNDPLTYADNDYRLGAGSLCIDRGDNGAIPADSADADDDLDLFEAVPVDFDGNPRRVDDPAAADNGTGAAPLVDIGAFERP